MRYVLGYGSLVVLGLLLLCIVVIECRRYRRVDDNEQLGIMLFVPACFGFTAAIATLAIQANAVDDGLARVTSVVFALALPAMCAHFASVVGLRIVPRLAKTSWHRSADRIADFVKAVSALVGTLLGVIACFVLEVIEIFTDHSGWDGIPFLNGPSYIDAVAYALGGLYALVVCILRYIRVAYKQ